MNNTEDFFIFEDIEDEINYLMWLYWKNGISTREFRKERMCDIRNVLGIEDAMNIRRNRKMEVEKIKNEMKKKW
ncbi:MAG: hypothetical protein EOL97_15585 [Spirochaetia bacterium]|nr:hypothetical protein [Spirochaetia bacterium]